MRKRIKNNPVLGVGLAAAALVLATGILLWNIRGPGGKVEPAGDPKRFYSNDDGKTWFADQAYKATPFDKDGKPAVRATVYRDLDTNEQFVAYLSRHVRARGGGFVRPMEGRTGDEMEHKKPLTGDTGWMRPGDPRVYALMNEVKSPKGSTKVEELLPD